MSRTINLFKKNNLHAESRTKGLILDKRDVELIAFCLMPNHFHILARSKTDTGVSNYMHRVLTAYSSYFNKRHNRSGRLFQGSFRAVHIENNTQLLHTSAYIHRNPIEIGWKDRESQYPWSSCHDFVKENRWIGLLETGVILDQFDTKVSYLQFLKTSTAKCAKLSLAQQL